MKQFVKINDLNELNEKLSKINIQDLIVNDDCSKVKLINEGNGIIIYQLNYKLNNSKKEYLKELKTMGLAISETDIYTTYFRLKYKNILIKFNLLYDGDKNIFIPKPMSLNRNKMFECDLLELFLSYSLNQKSTDDFDVLDYFEAKSLS